MRKVIVPILLSWAVAGCSSYASDRYALSMEAQEALQQAAPRAASGRVAVEPFTAARPGRSRLACRAAGPVTTPDGESFEEFIRQALIDQLQQAGLYSPNARTKLQGRLNEINFGSFEGIWFLDLTITDAKGRSLTAHEDYRYDASVIGAEACRQTAQALMPAVQNLIRKVVSHPTFLKMVAYGA